MALGYPPRESKHDESRFWAYHDALKAVGKAFALSPGTLTHRLAKLGAPIDPFDTDDWQVSPLQVFETLYRERCRELGAIPA